MPNPRQGRDIRTVCPTLRGLELEGAAMLTRLQACLAKREGDSAAPSGCCRQKLVNNSANELYTAVNELNEH